MNANASAARTYILTEIALLGLLALTIAVAFLNLGPLNAIIAAAISVASATLIILNFMHIRHSKPLLWIFVGAGFFWLGIMFALALSDFMTRGWK
jgi:cytochrome c oxidase subunit 4